MRRTLDGKPVQLEHVGIGLRGLHVLVAKQFLDGADIHAGAKSKNDPRLLPPHTLRTRLAVSLAVLSRPDNSKLAPMDTIEALLDWLTEHLLAGTVLCLLIVGPAVYGLGLSLSGLAVPLGELLAWIEGVGPEPLKTSALLPVIVLFGFFRLIALPIDVRLTREAPVSILETGVLLEDEWRPMLFKLLVAVMDGTLLILTVEALGAVAFLERGGFLVGMDWNFSTRFWLAIVMLVASLGLSIAAFHVVEEVFIPFKYTASYVTQLAIFYDLLVYLPVIAALSFFQRDTPFLLVVVFGFALTRAVSALLLALGIVLAENRRWI